MPSVSKNQQRLMALALHNPEKLHKKNKGVLAMGKKKLREYVRGRGGNTELKPHHKAESSNNTDQVKDTVEGIKSGTLDHESTFSVIPRTSHSQVREIPVPLGNKLNTKRY